ncbi:hypothetical protein [uncultured Dokdonia sp.]|uniref:hypothetical protein n=1 Tax=uncultured Dokdonia sp. TaxID=575653 RepID=UPI002624AA22|nr:hypothetical protein [uncultured Dokdonia sp.]
MSLNTFKKTLDLGVAKYMGEQDGFTKFVGGVLSAFSNRQSSDVDEGHHTRNFDWDGYSILTPCDCELAANEWLVNSGQHQKHMLGSSESYATMFALKCGLNTIFGNGGNLYVYRHDVRQHFSKDDFPFDIENLKISKEGYEIISLSKKNDLSIIMLKRNNPSEDFQPSKITIDKNALTNQGYSSWKLNLLENISPSVSYVALYSVADNDSLSEEKDLILIDYKADNIVEYGKIAGLQDFSKHPSSEKIAVLGKDLTVRSLKDFTIVTSTELPIARNKYDRGVISFSSCGLYIAISYAVNGEIEVRSADDLKILKTFEGYGIPQSDIAWDTTGRYLACRFMNRERFGYKLLVWDFKESKEVLNTASSEVEFIDAAFKWHPSSTKLACLVDKKRIQIFELE